jgi:hypothetical protein
LIAKVGSDQNIAMPINDVNLDGILLSLLMEQKLKASQINVGISLDKCRN